MSKFTTTEDHAGDRNMSLGACVSTEDWVQNLYRYNISLGSISSKLCISTAEASCYHEVFWLPCSGYGVKTLNAVQRYAFVESAICRMWRIHHAKLPVQVSDTKSVVEYWDLLKKMCSFCGRLRGWEAANSWKEKHLWLRECQTCVKVRNIFRNCVSTKPQWVDNSPSD